jgi:hypothetical protein
MVSGQAEIKRLAEILERGLRELKMERAWNAMPVVGFPLARPHTRLVCHNPNWPITPTRVAWSHPLAPKLWWKN